MNTTLVDSYVARLEAALRDEAAFAAVMRDLERDPAVTQPTLTEICRRFYGDANSKTPRREALKRIQSRHDSLLDFRAKSRAQAGKSAA